MAIAGASIAESGLTGHRRGAAQKEFATNNE